MDETGGPRGFTCNAVCSVSVTPPLLLISVDKRSQTLSALESAQAFMVDFLSASGQEASRVFANKGQNKFANVRRRPSEIAEGAPILSDVTLACAECRVVQTIEAGDHWLFIAQVGDRGGAFLGLFPSVVGQGAWSYRPRNRNSPSPAR